jgi:arylsulfatase A-like enzyme
LRPFFGYLSFSHPHPPLAPLQAYLDLYRDVEMPEPVVGDWIEGNLDDLPVALQRELQAMRNTGREFTASDIAGIRRAFYALCTHIDHQLRVLIGTLRERGMLGNTILCFTADHGDMLGNHRLWAKHWMYDDSNRVPMILVGTDEQRDSGRVGHHRVDDRLVGLRDVMSTLLDLAGVEIPDHCEGLSMAGEQQHEHIFGAHGPLQNAESGNPTRMIRDPRYKLVYYPAGNLRQLFDMREDPLETRDLAEDPDHQETLDRLSTTLIQALPEEERQEWVIDGSLTGWPDAEPAQPRANPWFSGQRGIQWPNA